MEDDDLAQLFGVGPTATPLAALFGLTPQKGICWDCGHRHKDRAEGARCDKITSINPKTCRPKFCGCTHHREE